MYVCTYIHNTQMIKEIANSPTPHEQRESSALSVAPCMDPRIVRKKEVNFLSGRALVLHDPLLRFPPSNVFNYSTRRTLLGIGGGDTPNRGTQRLLRSRSSTGLRVITVHKDVGAHHSSVNQHSSSQHFGIRFRRPIAIKSVRHRVENPVLMYLFLGLRPRPRMG
jgi:hypothetical protein